MSRNPFDDESYSHSTFVYTENINLSDEITFQNDHEKNVTNFIERETEEAVDIPDRPCSIENSQDVSIRRDKEGVSDRKAIETVSNAARITNDLSRMVSVKEHYVSTNPFDNPDISNHVPPAIQPRKDLLARGIRRARPPPPPPPLESPRTSSRPLSVEVKVTEVYEYSELVNGTRDVEVTGNNPFDESNNPFDEDASDATQIAPKKPAKPMRRSSDVGSAVRSQYVSTFDMKKARRLSLEEFYARHTGWMPKRRPPPPKPARSRQNTSSITNPNILSNSSIPEVQETVVAPLSDRISVTESSISQGQLHERGYSLPRSIPPPVPQEVNALSTKTPYRYSVNRYLPFQGVKQEDSSDEDEVKDVTPPEEQDPQNGQNVTESVSNGFRIPYLFPSRKSTISYERSQLNELRNDLQQTLPTETSSKRGRQLTLAELQTAKNRRTVDLSDENSVIRFLLKGRVYGYPGSKGYLTLNYLYFVFNNHPLLSILFAHHLNPFNKKKRVVVFICSLCFTFTITFVLTVAYYINQVATCRDGCNVETITGSNGSTSQICSGGVNDGMPYSSYKKECQYYNSMALSATAGILVTIYTSMLRFFATCGCFQGRTFFQEHCVGQRLYNTAEFFGGGVLLFFSVISFSMLLATILECWVTGVGFAIFKTTLVAKVWSFGFWFGWTLPYFAWKYPTDKKYFQEKQIRRAERKGSISERV